MSWNEPFIEKNEIIFLTVIAIVILGIAMIFIPYKTVSTMEFPAKIDIVNEENVADVNKPTDMLNFGRVSSGLRIKKYLAIDKGRAQDAIVYITIDGDIKQFIEIEENKFLITGPKDIGVIAKIPKNTIEGIYTGVIKIEFKMTLARKLMNIFS